MNNVVNILKIFFLELVSSTQRSNRGRPPHATENPKNVENSSLNTRKTTTTSKPPTTKPCPFGDLVSCMDACTDDPDFSNSCISVCKERCPATTGQSFLDNVIFDSLFYQNQFYLKSS